MLLCVKLICDWEKERKKEEKKKRENGTYTHTHVPVENGLKERSGERKESDLIVRHVAAADSTDDGFINVTSETPSDNPVRRYWRLLNICTPRGSLPFRNARWERFNYSRARACHFAVFVSNERLSRRVVDAVLVGRVKGWRRRRRRRRRGVKKLVSDSQIEASVD